MEGGFNAVNVGLLTVGAIMIYAGVKNLTLKQAIQDLISKSKKKQPVATGTGIGGGTSSFNKKQGQAGGGGGGGGGGSW
jgi:hypothetical protein